MWSVLVGTEKYVYVLGAHTNGFVTGKFAKDALPVNLALAYNSSVLVKNSRRWPSLGVQKTTDDIKRWMYDFNIVKVHGNVECGSCLSNSALYTPLSCLHFFCSTCVAHFYHKNIKCTECDAPPPMSEWSRYKLGGIPYAHLLRLLKTINIEDKSDIEVVSDISALQLPGSVASH
jgi:hypothetical protein